MFIYLLLFYSNNFDETILTTGSECVFDSLYLSLYFIHVVLAYHGCDIAFVDAGCMMQGVGTLEYTDLTISPCGFFCLR